MNILTKILTFPLRAFKNLHINFPSAQGLLGTLLPRTRFAYQNTVDTTLSAPVMACVFWIVRNFPEAPIVVRSRDQDGKWEIDVRHEASTLLRKPNPFYSGALLLMSVIADLVSTGNGYIIKIRSEAGRVVQLWWAPNSLVTPKTDPRDPTLFISHYDYTPRGVPQRIEVEDMIHLRWGLDPKNPRVGMSPLRSVLREIFTDDEAANFSASLLRNMGVPGVIISPKDGMSNVQEDQAEAIKAKFNENFTGDNRGSVMVMMGPTDVEVLSFSPEQMSLKDIRRLPEERISAVLGVPAIVAGLGAGLDRSTFANMKEAREMGYENGIIPLQRLVAADLTAQFLLDFEDDIEDNQIHFDLREVRVLQEDENALAKRHVELVLGGIEKRSEGRSAMGLPSEASDEVYLIPINVQEVVPGQAPNDEQEERLLPELAGTQIKDYPDLGADGSE